MKLVIQRVTEASVTIDGDIVGQIKKGFLVLVGVEREDTESIADKFLEKMLKLRIFEDENGKTNLSLKQVDGELLLVSQFTLLADCKGQNRPGFTRAGDPDHAKAIYDHMVETAKRSVPVVETGVFGADMKVSLVNDGPFTILLDETQV